MSGADLLGPLRRSIVLATALVACAPAVDGPTERQRAIDREDSTRLAAQLAALPGVVRAEVVLHRAARDPLATVAAAPGAAIVVIVDDQADRAAIAATTRQLAAANAPELAAAVAGARAIVVEVGATRPRLARVGPFTVEQASKTPLKLALGLGLAIVIALAGWIAWRERRHYLRGARAERLSG